jgi:GMP synthase (glutamine-hydrolysing)
LAELQAFDPKAVILSGGPSSVYEENAPRLDDAVFEYMLETKIAILGICYGLQELVRLAGGKIEPAEKREYGNAAFTTKPNRLFQSCETTFNVWMSHGDSVTGIPDNFEVIGTTDNCGFAAIMGEMRDVPIFGLQFHPEVNHTEHGTTILSNFTSIAGVVSDWSVDSFLEAETK